MSIEKLRPSFSLTEDRLKELEAIVPEAFADGKINWETLQEALGEHLEDSAQEHYSFTWPGKREARKLSAMPSKGALLPQVGEGLNEEKTRNIFIEGDNLEVLKLLQKSYANRVKMIYIDPPYNTGNDFIYSDDYSEPLEVYLRRTGQLDESGEKLTTNIQSSGRFHSKWLSMMYPRLKLAKSLMHNNGAILVSIGDDELAGLMAIMNELFGEENRIGVFVWRSRSKPTNAGNAKYRPQNTAEFVLAYGVQSAEDLLFNVTSSKSRSYPHEDSDGKYRTTTILTSNRGMFKRETMRFEVGGFSPDEENRWKAGKEVIEDLYKRNRIMFNEDGIPLEKKYEREENDPLYPIYTYMDPKLTGTAESGKNELNELLGNQHGLDTVKPVQLIKYFTATFSNPDDLIMDFFSGSCTSAQAVLELNSEGNGDRKYLMVQFPEPIDSGKFRNIAEIGKERIRSVTNRLIEESHLSNDTDLGFRVFNLGKSNFREWQLYHDGDQEQLETLFDSFEVPLHENWEPEYLIVELMLLHGFPLDSQITEILDVPVNKVKRVQADGINHELFICLDKLVNEEIFQMLGVRAEDVFICLDSALSDEVKIQIADQTNLKII